MGRPGGRADAPALIGVDLGDWDVFADCVRLCPASCIETLVVRGPDAEDFLQRLISCDLERVLTGSGSRGTLLDGKGRIIAYFDVHRMDDGLLLVTDEELVAALVQHLERLIILEDVELCRGGYAVVSIQGHEAVAKAEELTGLAPASFLASESWRDGWVVNRPRCPAYGFDLIVPVGEMTQLEQELQSHGVEMASPESSERARIEAGLPRIGYEVTERSLPPEVGLEDAISYDKGCYAGQEVLARIRTYGHVNRQLRRLSIEDTDRSELPRVEVGDDLFASDGAEKAVAKVTSIACGDGIVHLLASVRRSHAAEGTALIWQSQAGQEQRRYSGEVKLPFCP